MDFKTIIVNKNRGWRGLAEIKILNGDAKTVTSRVFSFSQDVWDDLLKGYVVIQDEDNYYVMELETTSALPHGHQRSVLIKDFTSKITKTYAIPKATWSHDSRELGLYGYIYDFIKNRNNHTTSDWNQIGLRVDVMI